MTQPETHDDPYATATAAVLSMRDAGARVFDAVTQAQPLAPHHLLLLRCVDAGHRSVGDVAAALDRHASSVSRGVDQLVQLDLLDRGEDPDDRRQVVLALTAEGRRLAERFDALDRAITERMLRELTPAQAEALADGMTALVAAARRLGEQLDADPGMLDELV